MLGRKQRTSNEDWLKAMANIEMIVPKCHIDQLATDTIAEMRKHIKGIHAAYAWSGGKDSIVLGHLCERAGVTGSMIGVCNLEYPAFLAWIYDNLPSGCEVINTGQDLQWLSENQHMLFPDNAKTASRWFAMVQHTAQRQYIKDNDIDILLLGRRRADGNYVGQGQNRYPDRSGALLYSPLADWKHEDILAHIHYNALHLPPIYGWNNGYKCGTHPWPARQYTNGNGWEEIYSIDPTIVKKAAEYISAAADFMEEVLRNG